MKKHLKILCTATHAGFTLIELLIVMIIIGLLAALVAPRMFGKVEKARDKAARAQISLFKTALDSYRLDTGHYPPDLQALVEDTEQLGRRWDGPYLKKLPKDPWGNDYYYMAENEQPCSPGPDGQQGTEDDICDETGEEEGEETAGGGGPVREPGIE
ncbi:MAG: type II secretion system major pseudopilin GspG [bacterium]